MALTSSLCLISIPSLKSVNDIVGRNHQRTTTIKCISNNNNCHSKSFFLNSSDEQQQRILNKAFKEPVAFMGGMFAGLLRLDLNEDPLKEWVTRTVEASGFTDEENITPDEQVPQQIEIE